MQSIRLKKHVKYFKYFCEFHLLSPWKRPVASSSRAQFFFWNFSNGNDLWWSCVPCWRVHVKIKLVLFYDYNSKQLWKNLARETNCQHTRWKNGQSTHHMMSASQQKHQHFLGRLDVLNDIHSGPRRHLMHKQASVCSDRWDICTVLYCPQLCIRGCMEHYREYSGRDLLKKR